MRTHSMIGFLVLIPCLGLSLGNSSCDPPKTPQFTGLKKRLAVLPIASDSFPLPDGTTVNVGQGIRGLLESVINEGNRYLLNQILPEDSIDNAMERPQYYIETKILSFELSNFGGGVRIGFTSGGPLPGPAGAGGSVHIDFARMDLEITLRDAYTLASIDTTMLTGYQATVMVSLDIPVSGIPIGIDFYLREPLRVKLIEILQRGMSQVDPLIDSKPWRGRVLEANDGFLLIDAGADANIALNRRFRLMKQRLLPQGHGLFKSFEEAYGTMIISDVGSHLAKGGVETASRDAEPDDLVQEIPLPTPQSAR